MHIIDWIIVGVFLGSLGFVGLYCRKFVKSVADFLVAGRGVGKFLGMTAADASGMGLISIIAWMQAGFVAGLSFYWIRIQDLALGIFIATTGWVTYRMRETQVLTLNELIEHRYSRKLRIFCGFLCFVAGIVNMGIYPMVEARFFIYFFGWPEHIFLLGNEIPLTALISGVLVLIALLFTFIGGQISIVVTDFMQGCLILIMYIVIGIFVYKVVQWDDIETALSSLPDPSVKVNPFKAREFGIAYIMMMAFRQFYLRGTSAASIARTQSAKSAHEARMMILVSKIKIGMNISIFFVPVAALAFMTLPCFADKAQSMLSTLDTIGNEKLRSELIVPLFLRTILPVGVMGLLAASFLALSISTYDTYFLAWGSTLIQDIINPLRKKPIDTKKHILTLRLSTVAVAITIWILAQLYRPTDYIFMFFFLTGSIYMSGAGIVIIGALYWRKATSQGAWSAMITGAILSVIGLVIRQVVPDFPLDGLEISFITWLAAIIVFVIVSLLTSQHDFDLNAMLNRKK